MNRAGIRSGHDVCGRRRLGCRVGMRGAARPAPAARTGRAQQEKPSILVFPSGAVCLSWRAKAFRAYGVLRANMRHDCQGRRTLPCSAVAAVCQMSRRLRRSQTAAARRRRSIMSPFAAGPGPFEARSLELHHDGHPQTGLILAQVGIPDAAVAGARCAPRLAPYRVRDRWVWRPSNAGRTPSLQA